MPGTGNTFVNYGGVCTIDGIPSDNNREGFCRARLMELTPEKEVVFDMWIDASDDGDPMPLSSFRSEFVSD